MSCFICGGTARTVPSMGDYEERVCVVCGHYRVSGTVVAQLERFDRKFDADQMRIFVQREAAKGIVPTITTYVAPLE